MAIRGPTSKLLLSETRLRRIEADQGSRDARMFVIEGTIIRSGEAKPADSFIYTGVPRSRPRHTDHRHIPELMDRSAAHGTKIHDRAFEQRLRKLEAANDAPRRLRIVFSATP